MLLDRQTQFSNRQAITASAASTDYINLQPKGKRPHSGGGVWTDIGIGNGVPLLVQVTDAFTGGTSVAVSVQTDDNPSFSSPKTVLQTAAIPVADLKAGYRFALDEFPTGTDEQYVRLYYTVVGTPTAGTITASAVAAVQYNG